MAILDLISRLHFPSFVNTIGYSLKIVNYLFKYLSFLNKVEFSPQRCYIKNDKYKAVDIVYELFNITGREAAD